MFVRMAITKIVEEKEDEFHKTQSEMNKILESYGVEILGYYYCSENNTVYCPANWGTKDRLVEIARDLKKHERFMELYKTLGSLTENTELREVISYPEHYSL